MNRSDINLQTVTESHSLPMRDPYKPINSDSLFVVGDEVLIQHRGEQYRLRRTRNDKLILTK
ncbi:MULTISPECIES: hemin uptake protein HemP [unclassified Nitrosomonas]|uniref:hemin uptake protein HemP n=1 Tax=unclassified Nitrosomonas TaxID=2609265 RepID=UPI0008982DB1|nr:MULTISPECIES: hemin uptake protein HemP [unclassified Nitrosomonas]MDV6343020.1 hemin uptake protein HemP [Nitrosomonas sp. Is37]SDY32041.1 Hemin uptake protein HemP [Nitrosomonas sp. Nm33]